MNRFRTNVLSMKHCLYKPSHPLLKKIVRHIAFQELDGTGNPNYWMTLFPNCTTNLCITLDTSLIFRRKGLVQNCISTSCTRPVTFSRSNTIEMINVQFEPFGKGKYLNSLSCLDKLREIQQQHI